MLEDLQKYQLNVCCLLEMKINTEVDVNLTNSHFINLKAGCKFYGYSFMISGKWYNRVYKTWKVSDKVSFLQLAIKHSKCNLKPTTEFKVKLTKNPRNSTTSKESLKVVIKKDKTKNVITILIVYAPHTHKRSNTTAEN